MDLSGIIFVVLAVAWAVYLIPKALKHHDEMARTRSVDRFSSTMRVLSRNGAPEAVPSPQVEVSPTRPTPTITRATARAAAARRRRVLGVLTVLLAGTAVAAHLGLLPWLATAAPGALIVLFLITARATVRQQASRRVVPIHVAAADHDIDAELDTEDTMGLSRTALNEALAQEVAAPVDEGSLWDPLPVTLPTYVTKARARRTVRTIELTQGGVTSSGRNAADSELVRQSEEQAALEATQATEAEQRKAAGA